MEPVASVVQTAAEAPPEFWRAGIKAIADGSAAMVSWALAVAGGSIVTIVSTSYLRPPPKMRWFYLLFLPGWTCLAVSVYHGDAIARGYLAAQVGKSEGLRPIAISMNPTYASQQEFLGYALIVFGVWLVAFLLWWVFDKSTPSGGSH